MHCLYCGKPLGFLKELTDGEFCCTQHRQRYKKLTKTALVRLLETREEMDPERRKEPGEAAAATVAQPKPFPGTERRPRDLGGLFRSLPQAKPLSLKPQASEEALREIPAPSLPGFSVPPVTPALGNAAVAWATLEPVLSKTAGAVIKSFVEPSEIVHRTPKVNFLSGRLRQGSTPTLQQAGITPAALAVPQPPPSPLGRDDRVIRPILESRTVVTMPFLPGLATGSSLSLARPILSGVAVEARLPAAAAVAESAVGFRQRVFWKESPYWALETLGLPMLALREINSRKLCLEHFPVAPRAHAAQAKPPVWEGATASLSLQPRIAALRSSLELSVALPAPGFQAPVAAVSMAPVLQEGAGPIFAAPRPMLPRLAAVDFASPAMEKLAERIPQEARQAAVSSVPLAEAGWLPRARSLVGNAAMLSAGLEPATPSMGLLPVRFGPVRPAAAMLRKVEPVLGAVQAPRIPVLNAVPVRESLREQGTVLAEVRIVNTAAEPLRSPGEGVDTSPSVLPLLASLFRHSRLVRGQRPSSVVFEFEGLQPRKASHVPLAYMEMAMPIRSPIVPAHSPLRIVETFEYLRPLDQPVLNPLEALLNLWRSTPAFLRFATAAVCLLILLWSAAPNAPISTLVENRWGEVQKSIGARAAVELTDDFKPAMKNWDGGANGFRTWAFQRAGFVRPGRLALYRPSMTLEDYQLEFLAQIEKKSVGWVYRAADKENYYASKITIVKPGPLPSVALVRYPVIDGKAGPRVEIPIRMLMHNDTPYRVQITVSGRDFTTSIEGQLVDYWRDDRLKVGGVGFFSDTGERARLYWMKFTHQDDFIGKVCAYFYPNPIQTRSGSNYQ